MAIDELIVQDLRADALVFLQLLAVFDEGVEVHHFGGTYAITFGMLVLPVDPELLALLHIYNLQRLHLGR